MNEIIKQKLNTITTQSGVYVMRAQNGEVIYVGKAKNLKNRVSQYFNHAKKQIKVQTMVDNIYDFDYFVTFSERDALALESNLIKKYQPFYNILLKDGKAFPYIKINPNEPFPKFEIVRRLSNDGSKYFGPYFSGIDPKEIIKVISFAYPIRSCKLKISTNKTAKRECLNFFLGLCSAPCTNRISEKKYNEYIVKAISFLKGNDNEIEKVLQEKMELSQESENFEKAIEYRDALKMVKKLKQKVIANMPKHYEIDTFGYQSTGLSGALCYIATRGGKINGVQTFSVIDASLNEGEVISNFIRQFYEKNKPPKNIVISDKIENYQVLEEYLFDKYGTKVNIIFPQKGFKKQLCDMAINNANQHMIKNVSREKSEYEKTIGAVLKLQETLKLKSLPKRIECYDISNISGTNQVASMVVFTNGKKDKAEYRKFKIQTVNGPNDFASMKEVISRRIEKLKQGDLSFGAVPDLIVIDGGKGQLSTAVEVIKNANMNIPIISLAKSFEEIFTPKSNIPILLKRSAVELQLLQNIRDEAHRFGITFHRSLRNKNMLASPLDNIKGVGEVKKKALLKQFNTTDEIKNATIEQLNLVKGIDKNLAKIIYDYFHK